MAVCRLLSRSGVTYRIRVMMAPIPYLPTTMKPKSTKERPFWQVPVIALGAGLGLSLLALIPLSITTGRRTSQAISPSFRQPALQSPPAVVIQSAHVAQVPQPAPRPLSVQDGLPKGEMDNYKTEISSLEDRAGIKQNTAKQMSDMGAPERGIELINEAVQMTQISRCLKNQMNRGVPFYEGKATCLTSVPADR